MTKQLPPDTPEQALITQYKGGALVVIAFAGSGKTTVLIKYAINNPDRRMLYIAFNRSVRDEAATKFPSHVDCKTSHQIAYAAVGKKYRHKQRENVSLREIGAALGTENWSLLKDVLETLNSFLYSADDTILTGHTPQNDKPQALSPPELQYRAGLTMLAERIWKKMIDLEDEFPMTHDGYLKLYQLSKPNLSLRYGVILYDEAQDASLVTSKLVLSQQCIKIFVGDRHQQIYRYRGAENALDIEDMSKAKRLYLTNSFRFGPNVAMVANAILALKEEPNLVVGRGKPDQVVMKLPANVPHYTVLHRTVNGTLQTAIAAAAAGLKIYWVGGIAGYRVSNLADIYWLSTGKTENIKSKGILREFRNISQYAKFAKESGNNEMRRTLTLVQDPNLHTKLQLLRQNTVENESEAQITLSTVHRAKGLEWLNVVLADDFPDIFEMMDKPELRDDEINLLYVASTRAMQILVINSIVEMILRYALQQRQAAQNAPLMH
ncbi:3'-5' exonuclease [Eoetvoesiella caeni]